MVEIKVTRVHLVHVEGARCTRRDTMPCGAMEGLELSPVWREFEDGWNGTR